MLVCGVSAGCDTSQSRLFMLSEAGAECCGLLLLYIYVHFGLFFFTVNVILQSTFVLFELTIIGSSRLEYCSHQNESRKQYCYSHVGTNAPGTLSQGWNHKLQDSLTYTLVMFRSCPLALSFSCRCVCILDTGPGLLVYLPVSGQLWLQGAWMSQCNQTQTKQWEFWGHRAQLFGSPVDTKTLLCYLWHPGRVFHRS